MAYRIGKYFTLDEMLSSYSAKKRGIDNRPTAEEQKHLVKLVSDILDPIREGYGKPVLISSGFRCKRLNTAIGGSKTSAHMRGDAADTKAHDMKSYQNYVLEWAKTNNFDQIIIEYPKNGIASWIHIGIFNGKGEQRRQIITTNDGVTYKNWYK